MTRSLLSLLLIGSLLVSPVPDDQASAADSSAVRVTGESAAVSISQATLEDTRLLLESLEDQFATNPQVQESITTQLSALDLISLDPDDPVLQRLLFEIQRGSDPLMERSLSTLSREPQNQQLRNVISLYLDNPTNSVIAAELSDTLDAYGTVSESSEALVESIRNTDDKNIQRILSSLDAVELSPEELYADIISKAREPFFQLLVEAQRSDYADLPLQGLIGLMDNPGSRELQSAIDGVLRNPGSFRFESELSDILLGLEIPLTLVAALRERMRAVLPEFTKDILSELNLPEDVSLPVAAQSVWEELQVSLQSDPNNSDFQLATIALLSSPQDTTLQAQISSLLADPLNTVSQAEVRESFSTLGISSDAGLRIGEITEQTLESLSRTVVNTYAQDRPTEEELLENLALQLLEQRSSAQVNLESAQRQFQELIKNLPAMDAIVSADVTEGNVPLTVNFDAIDSSDPTATTIPDDNYVWSYVDNTGVRRNLGGGPRQQVTFTEPGVYYMNLLIESGSTENVIPSRASVAIRVQPSGARADFLVNGEVVGRTAEVSLEQANNGIILDPTPTTSSELGAIEEYFWTSTSSSQSYLTPEPHVVRIANPGRFNVSLEVKDTSRTLSQKRVTLIVSEDLAHIGLSPPGDIFVGQEVVFSGSESSFRNAEVETYDWILTKTDSLDEERFDGESFRYRFPESGQYEARLTVTSTAGTEITSLRTIEVRSQPPLAQFQTRQFSDQQPNTAVFDASRSIDPEGQSLRYRWDFDGDDRWDLTTLNEPVVTHTYPTKGRYLVTLEVEDTSGEVERFQRDVTISQTLALELNPDATVGLVGEALAFTALAPAAQEYVWDFGDGNIETRSSPGISHVWRSPGAYDLTLIARNRTDETTLTRRILIGDGAAPLASGDFLISGLPALYDAQVCETGGYPIERQQVLSLSASNSRNRDGSDRNLQLLWELSDGRVRDGESVELRFQDPSVEGECSWVDLTVTDRTTGTSSTERIGPFLVLNAVPQMASLVIEGAGDNCRAPCNIRAEALGAIDPDGTIARYRWWAQLTTDPEEKIDLHTTRTPVSSLRLPARGRANLNNTYQIFVEMTDDTGETSLSTDLLAEPVLVRVNNGDNPLAEVDFRTEKTVLRAGESVRMFSYVIDPLGESIPPSALEWDFENDGRIDSTGEIVEHAFSEPGTYRSRLSVTLRGVRKSKLRTITVLPAPAEDASAPSLYRLSDTTLLEEIEDPDGLSFQLDTDVQTDTDQDGDPTNDLQDLASVDTPLPEEISLTTPFRLLGTQEDGEMVLDVSGVLSQFLLAGFNSSETTDEVTPALLTPIVETSAPSIVLQLGAQSAQAQPGEPIEIYASVRTLEGFPVTGEIQWSLPQEGASILQELPLDNGFSSLRIAPQGTEPDADSTLLEIQAEAQTPYGPLFQRLFLPVL